MQTYTLEIRTDFATDTVEKKEEMMLALAIQAAQELYTKALLISDNRKPQIALRVGDMMMADREFDILTGKERTNDEA